MATVSKIVILDIICCYKDIEWGEGLRVRIIRMDKLLEGGI